MSLFKNFVEIIGNLGDNPKYILSSQNQPRYTFDVCVNKPYKQGNEWKTKTTWFKGCTAWGNLATTLSRMQFYKGERVQVEGEMDNNDWVDAQTGIQMHTMYLKVIEMRKMAKPASSGNKAAKSNGGTAPASAQGTQQQADYQSEFYAQQQADMDNLPF